MESGGLADIEDGSNAARQVIGPEPDCAATNLRQQRAAMRLGREVS